MTMVKMMTMTTMIIISTRITISTMMRIAASISLNWKLEVIWPDAHCSGDRSEFIMVTHSLIHSVPYVCRYRAARAANLGQNRTKSAMRVIQVYFFTISSEFKFHGSLLKKSSRSNQPLSSNLLKTISQLSMPIHRFAAKHGCFTKESVTIHFHRPRSMTLLRVYLLLWKPPLKRWLVLRRWKKTSSLEVSNTSTEKSLYVIENPRVENS